MWKIIALFVLTPIMYLVIGLTFYEDFFWLQYQIENHTAKQVTLFAIIFVGNVLGLAAMDD